MGHSVLNLFHFNRGVRPQRRGDIEAIGMQRHHLLILENDNSVREGGERLSIAGEKVFSLTDADNERTSALGSHDQTGEVRMNHRNAESAMDLVEGLLDCSKESRFTLRLAFLVRFPQAVREDFGISVGEKSVTRLDEFFFQFEEVLNYPIMDYRQFSRLIEVGVSVFVGRCPMGGPTSMADSQFALNRFGLASVGKIFNPTTFFTNLHAVSIQDGEAGRVITPVFETAQRFQENRLGFTWPHVGNNSTHRKLVLAGGCDRVKR